MKTAVLIPCYNEELTIEKVIKDFKKELPDADIYVYDNNSKDKTAQIAKANGAIVKHEYRQGKGNVVRSMFRDIDADIYVMVDGDDTYPAEEVHKLIRPVVDGEADMVIGDRLTNGTYQKENKRHFHEFGNNLVKKSINVAFKTDLRDIMTGYRVFNKIFVKTMPVMSPKFEIETEMSLHALDKKFIIKEMPKVTLVNIMALEMTGNAHKNKEEVWINFDKTKNQIYNASTILIKAGINTNLYNFPLCNLDERIYSIARKSITDYKVRYKPECIECKAREKCGGFFNSTINIKDIKIKPIK